MDLLACIDLALFDLQLLVRLHPQWSDHPMAVLTEDRPTAPVVVANAAARQAGILPGQRYNQALSCAPHLRAGVITAKVRQQALLQVAELLRQHSPDLEPSQTWPGVFWLSARGMGGLYASAKTWAKTLAGALREAGWAAHVVVGPTRFATYAAARGLPDPLDTKQLKTAPPQTIRVLKPDLDQRQALRDIALDRLDLQPSTRDALAQLGITRLGAFLQLPESAITERFGREVAAIFALARGEVCDPLQAQPHDEPLKRAIYFDDPHSDLPSLLFAIKRELVGLREALVARQAAIASLFLSFSLDRPTPRQHLEVLHAAEPTLDVQALIRLVHLRLESHPLPAPIREVHLSLAQVPAMFRQLELFAREQERNICAATDALAKVRAEVGNQAVVYLTVGPGHLPEAVQQQTIFDTVKFPQLASCPCPTLVRRLLCPAQALISPPRDLQREGWYPLGVEHGMVKEVVGPYLFAGGWWRSNLQREYYFIGLAHSAWLWVYYDHKRRQWFCHAQVG